LRRTDDHGRHLDALRPAGVEALDMPATPARVWHAWRRRPERSFGMSESEPMLAILRQAANLKPLPP